MDGRGDSILPVCRSAGSGLCVCTHVILVKASGATRIKPSPATGQETPRCLERENRSMRGTEGSEASLREL